MNAYDEFYRRATRDAAYFSAGALNAAQQVKVYELRARYQQPGTFMGDKEVARIPIMRDDGAAVLVDLTVDRLDCYASAYDAHEAWTAVQFSRPLP